VGVGILGGAEDLLGRGVGAAVGDIVGDRSAEQERLLGTMPIERRSWRRFIGRVSKPSMRIRPESVSYSRR